MNFLKSPAFRIGLVVFILLTAIIAAYLVVHEILINAASLGSGNSIIVYIGLLFVGLMIAVSIALMIVGFLFRRVTRST